MLNYPRDASISICILRLSAIGDVCHTIPVVRALQDYFRNAKITWIIGSVESQLVNEMSHIEFHTVDKSSGFKSLGQLRKKLKGRRFDVLLHMQCALRASLLSTVISADIRLGFDRKRARDFQQLFVNRQIEARSRQHVMSGLMGFALYLGVPEFKPRWAIPLAKSVERWADDFLVKTGDFAVISVAASKAIRDWMPQRYAQIADHLVKEHQVVVVLSGGGTERERVLAARIQQAAHSQLESLVGNTSLTQLAGLLARAKVVISADSGPAHLAVAMGAPVVGLYATTNPLRTGPFESSFTVNKYPEIAQQYLHKNEAQLRWGQRINLEQAMESISTDDVIEKLSQIFNRVNTNGQ